MLVIIFVCTLNTGEATLTNGIISMRVQSARGGGWATRLQILATLTLVLLLQYVRMDFVEFC